MTADLPGPVGLSAAVGSKVQPGHQETRAGDVVHSLADISRARAFGFNPKHSLEEGIRETVQAMQTCHPEDPPQFGRESTP